jgi:pseudouridine kinase
MKPRVACFGAAAVDTSVRAVRPLERSTSNRVTRLGDFGGVARNVGAMLARLGCEVAFAGPIGQDVEGDSVMANLLKEGVDVSSTFRDPKHPTATYTAVLEPDGELAFGLADMAIMDQLAPEFMLSAFDALRDQDAWFFDANLPLPVLAALIEHRPSGVMMVADSVSVPKAARLLPCLEHLDILFASGRETEILTGGDPNSIKVGNLALVTGLGADGVLITDTAGTRMLPALVPRVVSVNGAGDALAAGTLLGLLRGQGIDDAVLLGSKAAAMVVQSDQLIPDGFNADTLDAWQ